jgi:hypothetical protein
MIYVAQDDPDQLHETETSASYLSSLSLLENGAAGNHSSVHALLRAPASHRQSCTAPWELISDIADCMRVYGAHPPAMPEGTAGVYGVG